MHTTFQILTRGPGLVEFTYDIERWLDGLDIESGLLTLFCQHTSCSLLIQENADPDVRWDLNAFFKRLVPAADDPSQDWITHRAEGPDDMPAHIKAAMMPVQLSIPVARGQMMLGTWQGIYLFEHRDRPHERKVALHFLRD